MEIPVMPSIDTQRKIASVLTDYDDLIENNNRRIKLLEEMAQRVYREWFVHFRYPGHESVPLVDSELGSIPEGWTACSLSDLVSTQYGYTESATSKPIGPRFLRGMDINKTSYVDWSRVPYCPIAASDLDRYRLVRGDVLVIRMADPGKVGIVEQDVNAVFASYLIRVRPVDARIDPYVLFYFMSSDQYQSFVSGASTGTTRKSLSASLITSISTALPPSELQQLFVSQVAPLRGLVTGLVSANTTLRNSRDLLLPRLISGEIDVTDLDIAIPEAAA
jgi:type I restriction enzyme S subunit